jgi:predicted nucleic acid-binding protein
VIVVDTNLVAYLLLGGSGLAAAKAVFARDAEWAAPLLWRSEFRNVLAGCIRKRQINLADAERIASHAEGLLLGREHVVASEVVLRLAAGSKCTAYDCEFVGLAHQLRIPLVTSDGDVLQAFPETAVTPTAFLGNV